MTPSSYQQDIYQALITTTSHILVGATAGSGKTTTIVEGSKLIPYGKKALFVAFNKSIVLELKKRLPVGVECSTMHSLGAKCIFNHYPGEKKIDGEGKQIKFIVPHYENKNTREKWIAIYQVDRIMKLARATMTKPNLLEIEQLCDTYAIDADKEQMIIATKALTKFYAANDDPDRYNITIDFQDMIEMVVRNQDINTPQYDYVFIDEVQDLSKLDQLFINRLVKPIKGRKIMVGDEKQAIYSFRGGDPNSFQFLRAQPNTITLPLSISYRCPKLVVKEAKKIYDDIEPYEENGDGIVRKGKVQEIQEGDIVICRNTRPLIEVYLQLLEQDKKVTVVGKEMEKGLLKLTSPYDTDSKTVEIKRDLRDKLKTSLVNELKGKGINNPNTHPRYLNLMEKIDILEILMDKFATIGEVEKFIETTFDDEERDGIRLMTIHKSKGLENDKVFYIRTFDNIPLIPSKYAVTGDMLKQERNLNFVATTRAKNELVYLDL